MRFRRFRGAMASLRRLMSSFADAFTSNARRRQGIAHGMSGARKDCQETLSSYGRRCAPPAAGMIEMLGVKSMLARTTTLYFTRVVVDIPSISMSIRRYLASPGDSLIGSRQFAASFPGRDFYYIARYSHEGHGDIYASRAGELRR